MKRELLDEYRGRWVAVNDEGDVVADADELDHLLAELKRHAARADLVVQRVPEADAPLFVGLG
ncbi:MAG TPA: DUF5678 domain-containing protein [Ilumatobacter sp.]|nr:DUF5678 domain-containing protein [Ilumatobacter sp.]